MGDKKNDMDRIGLFQEMGYVTIGDKYKSANQGMILLQVLFLVSLLTLLLHNFICLNL